MVGQVGVAVVAVDGSAASQSQAEAEADSSTSELQTAMQFTRMTGYPGLYLFRRDSDGGLTSSAYDGGWYALTRNCAGDCMLTCPDMMCRDLLGLLRWVSSTHIGEDLSVSAELLARNTALKEQLRALGVPVDGGEEDDDCDECSL